jgi:hypothetical protein
MPFALAITKQVYANHYMNGAVAVTAIAGSPGNYYLVYAHRSNVDVLDGIFGGVIRRIIERRVKKEAPGVLRALRMRLESGDPPEDARVRASAASAPREFFQVVPQKSPSTPARNGHTNAAR